MYELGLNPLFSKAFLTFSNCMFVKIYFLLLIYDKLTSILQFNLLMGNNQGKPNSNDIDPYVHSIVSNSNISKGDKLPIDALNSLLEIAFQKISIYTNVSCLEQANKNMNSSVDKFERGKNFEGVINEERKQLLGMCRVYSSNHIQLQPQSKMVFTVFFGNFENKVRKGEGLQVKSYITIQEYEGMKRQNKIALNLKQIEILKLNDWDSLSAQKGIYLSIIKKETIVYEGDFIDKHFLSGQLQVKNEDQPIIKYKGKFNSNNQIQDTQGYLEFVGKTKYRGGFKQNERSGLGVEDDENKKTRFVGNFYKNKKNGYGELTYKNRENIKLKAFWNDDMVKKDEGVFVTAIGQKLELMGDNTYI